MNSVPLTFGSLFAGIGGFDLGFERAGMACKWQVEIEDHATSVLTKHWPHVPKFRDVREFPPRPDSPWLGGDWRKRFAVNAVLAGFPCQDISYAGLGAGLDGERSGLLFQAIRVVRQLRPDCVVLENVAALLTRGLDRVLGTLAGIGYDAEWHCVPASAVGAPHERKRVFIIASANSNSERFSRRAERNGIEEQSGQYAPFRGDSLRFRDNVSNSSCELRNGSGIRSEQAGRNESTDGSWWQAEPGVGRVADGFPGRVDRLRGLGNAIVPQVAELIANRVVELLHAQR